MDLPLHATSCSWLNAVEGFFSKLTRQSLKRGVFRSWLCEKGRVRYDFPPVKREGWMGRFVEGAGCSQLCLLPECLDDWVHEDNPVHVIEAFVETLDLATLVFSGVSPATTGRPAYHPAVLLKLYIYGYL